MVIESSSVVRVTLTRSGRETEMLKAGDIVTIQLRECTLTVTVTHEKGQGICAGPEEYRGEAFTGDYWYFSDEDIVARWKTDKESSTP